MKLLQSYIRIVLPFHLCAAACYGCSPPVDEHIFHLAMFLHSLFRYASDCARNGFLVYLHNALSVYTDQYVIHRNSSEIPRVRPDELESMDFIRSLGRRCECSPNVCYR